MKIIWIAFFVVFFLTGFFIPVGVFANPQYGYTASYILLLLSQICFAIFILSITTLIEQFSETLSIIATLSALLGSCILLIACGYDYDDGYCMYKFTLGLMIIEFVLVILGFCIGLFSNRELFKPNPTETSAPANSAEPAAGAV
jgi:hypothetical protein